jgi:ribonuclease P protein component
MRAERLRRTADIELVRRSGEVRTDRHFTIRSRRNGLAAVRVAVASPKAIGGAVKRNLARRRVRESIRTLLQARSSAPGTDLLVVTRAPAVDAPAGLLRDAIAKQLEAVLGA